MLLCWCCCVPPAGVCCVCAQSMVSALAQVVRVVYVNEFNTSSRCWFCKDACKDTPLEEDKKKRTLTCTRCKRTLDRDLHASYNILEVAAQYALDGTRPAYLDADHAWKFGNSTDVHNWSRSCASVPTTAAGVRAAYELEVKSKEEEKKQPKLQRSTRTAASATASAAGAGAGACSGRADDAVGGNGASASATAPVVGANKRQTAVSNKRPHPGSDTVTGEVARQRARHTKAAPRPTDPLGSDAAAATDTTASAASGAELHRNSAGVPTHPRGRVDYNH